MTIVEEMRRSVLAACLVAAALIAEVASANPRAAVPTHPRGRHSAHATRRAHAEEPGSRSRSVGFPWDGRLERPARVVESDVLRYVSEYAPGGHFHGTWELVKLLERAAARVARRLPGGKLSIGELSKVAGGRIDGHHSHENGRDADVSFYVLDGANRSYPVGAFVRFDAHGNARTPNRGLRFDDARNWELVSRLVTDPDARVQYLFVASHIRRRLLAEGERRHAPRSVLTRAAATMVQPRGNPHDNHFHVRIFCPPSDRPACHDAGPIWSWYPGLPPGASALPSPLSGSATAAVE